MKDHADQLSKVLITASEICTILYIIRKPNSNNSKYLGGGLRQIKKTARYFE